MVQSCSAYGCKNRYQKDKNISFHKFPLARPDICGKWVSAIKRRNFKPTKYSNICSQHFTRDCFKRQCNNRVLKDNAVPSLFSFSKLQASSMEDSFSPDLDFPLSLPLSDAEEMAVPEPDPTRAEPEIIREPHFSACVSCDHNYTVEDTGQQKKRVEQLQEQMEKLRKRLKTVQQKCRRQERQLERFRTMSRAQIQKDPMSRAQIQKDPMSRAQVQKGPMSRAQVQKGPMSRAQVQKDPMSRAQVQKGPMSRAQVQKDPMSRAQVQKDPMSRAQVQKDPMSRAQVQKDPMSRAQVQKDPMSRAQVQKDPMSRAQVQKDPMSRAQVQKDPAPGSSFVMLPTEIYDALKGIETIGAL